MLFQDDDNDNGVVIGGEDHKDYDHDDSIKTINHCPRKLVISSLYDCKLQALKHLPHLKHMHAKV